MNTELGMNSTQMAELFTKILQNNKEHFDKAIDEITAGKETSEERISAMLWTYSKVIVPTAIFGVIEANNRTVANQIEHVLAHVMVDLQDDQK